MEKIITVGKTAKPKNGYIESLTISGNYLKQNGFEMGDLVKLVVTKNEIRIIKNVNTTLLTQMGAKNPHLLTMIENLSLTTK
ncbi:MAG TPA: hypothetical protein P5084_09175 [Paludibacter sp.]|nr:hypothetical protein [Paludibacter sp.]